MKPPLIGMIAACLLINPTAFAAAEGATGNVAQEASGLITGLTGSPVGVRTAGGAGRSLSLGDRVSIAEELQTRQDEMLEILWDRRALILVHPQSAVVIQEPKAGQTQVDLRSGSVRVALAYGSGPSDMVAVQTASSRVFTRGGIMEVDVAPPLPSLFARVASMLSGPEPSMPQTPVETVRVLEGQSGIEPLQAKRLSEIVEAGYQAQIAAGTVTRTAELPQGAGAGVGLAAIDRRHGTPRPLMQRIVGVHVNHALEVERLMTAAPAAVDQAGGAAGPDIKGTIVATSLGIPTTSLPQPPTGSGSPPTGPPPPTVTSPLPTLPPIQTPSITTLAPSQSGGLNSRNLLKDLLDDDKGKGRNKGRGKD